MPSGGGGTLISWSFKDPRSSSPVPGSATSQSFEFFHRVLLIQLANEEGAGGRLHGSFRGQTCRRQASLLPGFHWPRGSSFHILTIKFDWLLSPPGALLLEKAQDAQFPSLIPLGCSDSGVQKTNPGFIQSHLHMPTNKIGRAEVARAGSASRGTLQDPR